MSFLRIPDPGEARLFDAAEAAFGAVDILINNATGWRADTFSPTPQGRFGHPDDVARVIAYRVSDHAHLITANRVHLR